MKTISLLLLAMLSCAASAAQLAGTYRYTCRSADGKCPPPPLPPIAPIPPIPPTPPVPPPVPLLPAIPAAAHTACAGKSAGTTLTYVIRKGETITGTCEIEDGKMLFILSSYSIGD
jgi:hypothetical protein